MPRHLRIFAASPSDVDAERLAVFEVISRLPYDPLLRGQITLELVSWDGPFAAIPLLASMDPQAAITAGLPKPSECDFVVVIIGRRLGTHLGTEYAKDGGRLVTGTEWEYEDALEGNRANGKPDVLVYRRLGSFNVDVSDTAQVRIVKKQFKLVQNFFARMRSEKRGYIDYSDPEDFATRLTVDLKELIRRANVAPPPPDELIKSALRNELPLDEINFEDIEAFSFDVTSEPNLRGQVADRITAAVKNNTMTVRADRLASMARKLMKDQTRTVAKAGVRLALALINRDDLDVGALSEAAAHEHKEVKGLVIASLEPFSGNPVLEVLSHIGSELSYWKAVQAMTVLVERESIRLDAAEKEVAIRILDSLLGNPDQSTKQRRLMESARERISAR